MSTLRAKSVVSRETVSGSDEALLDGSEEIADVLTKFFFRENQLCFQILLKTVSDETVFYKEFKDYSEYTNTLNDLRKARLKGATIQVPEKITDSGSATLKVA